MHLKFVGTREHPNGVKVSGKICTAGAVFNEKDPLVAQMLLQQDGFEQVEVAADVAVAPKRRRGRPRKVKAGNGSVDQGGNADKDIAAPGSSLG